MSPHHTEPDACPIPPLGRSAPERKVLFASAHSIIDCSSGAAVATLDVLQALAAEGFECQAFCTTKLDYPTEVGFEQFLGGLHEPHEVCSSVCGSRRVEVLTTRRNQVPITMIRRESTRIAHQRPEEVRAVLESFEEFLQVQQPDVLLTFGGDPITNGMIALAKQRAIPVVFSIHNFAYTNPQPFAHVDYCIVPSEFARRFYRDKVGLDCHALPNPVDWDRVRVEGSDPRYVTFVNPAPEKGVSAFVRIAEELGRRRPEIPFLVVESRGNRATLAAYGLGRDRPANVHVMTNTTDPRRFWSVTKIALMPSVWWENQPAVGYEAMINGIPVIGSDRGGIPETLGDCGFLLPLPESLTPASRVPPAAEEVEPWVETIIRLWDDRALYEEQSIKAKKEAQRWHPDRLRPLYAEFFRNVRLQSRPPFVPRTEGEDRVPGVGRENGDGRPASSGTVGQGTWSIRQGANPHFPSQKIRGGQTVEPNLHPGLASIIVPCFNQREFTQLCLRALFRHSRPPWELIVVDNGSTDGTANYLAGVQDGSNIPVTVISNPHNLGFPRAINQGLEVARGEYLVLLNNDTVVTDGWLDQLIALSQVSVERAGEAGGGVPASAGPNTKIPPEGGTPAEGLATPIGGLQSGDERGQETCARHEVHATIGLVGPMSNYAAPPQLVEPVPYRDLAEMQDFARRWRDQHRGKWFTVPRLSGFCLLMKRAVFDTVGRLDERFSLGFFDDDDLALRARRAGFELAVAHDLFLHHFGSRTFAGNGIDAERLLEENARRFADKWGQATPRGHRIALRAWTPGNQPPMTRLDPDLNARLQLPDSTMSAHGANRPLPSGDRPGPRAKVTLVMIVRDEQDHLPRCLESVRGVFDEIVVVDTGSVDRTKAIAEEFGARVFDFVWIDDFSAARNAALAHATGDFVFWLDADDVLDPPEREKVTALLGRLRPGDGTAYVVRCACDPGADGSGGQTVVDQIRLFPRRDDVRWTYRVHEQILPALKRVGVPVQWTDLVVRHTGYTDPAVRARKLDRDARIALQELKERPEDPFILFNLGAIAVERQQWPAALSYLSRSLARSAPSDSITRKLFALIARVHQMIGDSRESLRVCAEGLALDPADAELWFRKAVVHRQRGESAEAEACWRRILGLSRPEQFASLDMGIYGHLTRRNLAVLAAERGDRAAAARLWNEVLAECPGDHEALSGLERLQCPRMRRPFPPSRPRPPASPVRVRSGRTTEP